MKRLIICLGALFALTVVTPDAAAQQRRGNRGAGQGHGLDGTGIQSQTRVQTRVGNQSQGQGQRTNQGRQTIENLSTNYSESALLRMWEEEKLARDVYTQLAKTSKLPIFRNISRAERQHMQAIERLVRGGRALNDVPGAFTFPEYQRLYDSLIASGTRSPLDALKVGAKIEEMDIADLRTLMNQTTDSQIQQVLGRLMQGSKNHLRAFASQIAKNGGRYDAEFLTQAEFDQIASSSGQGHGAGGPGAGSPGRGRQGGARQGGGKQRRGR